MLRLLLIIFLFCIPAWDAVSQLVINDNDHSAVLLDFKTFPNHPAHDVIIRSSDTEYERLFKSYFHPTSFEEYKSFFLAADWGGFSVAEFDAWQSRIAKDKLYLRYAMHIQVSDGREFIVCQYSMESEAYSFPESVKFKKVQGVWKHIHVRNDDVFKFLHQLGKLRLEYIEKAVQEVKTNLEIDQVPDQYKEMIVEKFDRMAVFNEMESDLIQDGLSGPDVDIARNFFLEKDDQAFVEWVCGKSGKNDIDFMQMMNDKTGIKLFNFTKAQNN